MPLMHSQYREAGAVAVDDSVCIRCGECAAICPGEVLSLEGGRIRVRADSPFGCLACGHCMMVCPKNCVRVTGRGLSPDDLRPLPLPEAKASADSLSALMQARRSVRRFTGQEVPQSVLDRVVAIAATAPMGIPPWDVGCVAVSGRGNVRALANRIVAAYEKLLFLFKPWTLALMRPFFGRATYDQFLHFILPLAKTYIRHRREGRDVLFYDAPALLLFHHSPYADAGETYIACTYAMLAAESLGLGSTMIGAAAPIIQRDRALCRRLGIPDGNKPAIALILGYPATHFRRTVARTFAPNSNTHKAREEHA